MPASQVRTWAVTETAGYETAWVKLGDGTLRGRGRAVGTVPEPYWISYELDTARDFVTTRLQVGVDTETGRHHLDLRRDEFSRWTANGNDLPDVTGALDCDLAFCPLTNTMPVLRHGLHLRPGEQQFLIAWVCVPNLTVLPSNQTYTHLAFTDRGARIRFASGDFRSDIEFDRDGFVVDYPGLARLTQGTRGTLRSNQQQRS